MDRRTPFALLGLVLVTSPATGSKGLNGFWGAAGTNLTLNAQGGTLYQECASGTFGPVSTDAKGRFKIAGHFEAYAPGPQRADEAGGSPSATYEGQIKGEVLVLKIRPLRGPMQSLSLQQGKRAKLIRCL